MAREFPDWITAYLKYVEDTEPPLSYHTWTAISLIAAALKRRVYIRWGHKQIFPNLYIVLIGQSGKCRKGTAMEIGEEIVRDAGIAVTSESVTREQLIRSMSEAIDSFEDPSNGKIQFHCSLYCMSQELAVFLGQGDTRFLSDLTDWYDCRREWEYSTKSQGKDHITGVCFNLFGATASDWLQSILPEEAIGGGFTSRIIFIVEDRKGKIVPGDPPRDEEVRAKLTADLQQVQLMVGQMQFTVGAKKMYEGWYTRQERDIEAGHSPVEDPRFSGYCDRRATHARKIAMVLSASRSNSMQVTKEDFERAVATLVAIEPKMGKTFGGMGKARYGEMTERVISLLESKKEIKRSQLLSMYYRDIDTMGLDIIEKVLYDMHLIDIVYQVDGNDKLYKLR